jgi:hypothetical protein
MVLKFRRRPVWKIFKNGGTVQDGGFSTFYFKKITKIMEKIVSQEINLKWWPKTKMASFKKKSCKFLTETSPRGLLRNNFLTQIC